jgi:hypothetical protein
MRALQSPLEAMKAVLIQEMLAIIVDIQSIKRILKKAGLRQQKVKDLRGLEEGLPHEAREAPSVCRLM